MDQFNSLRNKHSKLAAGTRSAIRRIKFYLVNNDKKKILEFCKTGDPRIFSIFISLLVFRCLSNDGQVIGWVKPLKEGTIILELKYPVFSINWMSLKGQIATPINSLKFEELVKQSTSTSTSTSLISRYYGPRGAAIMVKELLALLGNKVEQL